MLRGKLDNFQEKRLTFSYNIIMLKEIYTRVFIMFNLKNKKKFIKNLNNVEKIDNFQKKIVTLYVVENKKI